MTRSRSKVLWTLTVTLILALGVTQPVFAQHKLVIFSLNSGGTHPQNMNDHGTVVGWLGPDEQFLSNFVRYANGAVRSFTVPARQECVDIGFDTIALPVTINNRGMMGGVVECYSFGIPTERKPFMRLADGNMIDISGDEALDWVIDMNDYGQILGSGVGCDFVIRNIAGQIICVNHPGGPAFATAINNHGTVVGNVPGTESGFIYRNGAFTEYKYRDAHGATYPTNFIDINNRDEILASRSVGNPPVARYFVLHRNGQARTLKLPNLPNSGVTSFNYFGDVLGIYYPEGGFFSKGFIVKRLAR